MIRRCRIGGRIQKNILAYPILQTRQMPCVLMRLSCRSCQRLAAVTLTNVVFPTQICGEPVRHFTPGRQWNSLYTWDSGFIGLGMLELSEQLAADILNAYLTPDGDKENAFILHGTPLYRTMQTSELVAKINNSTISCCQNVLQRRSLPFRGIAVL